MIEVSTAILGLCLIACILALAGVSVTLALIVYRRFGQREADVGQDIAERIIDSWNKGADTHRNMVQDIQAETEIAAETKVRRQQFRRTPENLKEVMNADDVPTELGTFGEAPIIPEMVTPGIKG